MIVAMQGSTCPRQSNQDTQTELPQLGVWRGHSDRSRLHRGSSQVVNSEWARFEWHEQV
jgi:hypothetical protein